MGLSTDCAGSKYYLGGGRKVTEIQHRNPAQKHSFCIVLKLVVAFASSPSAYGRLRGLFQQGREEGCKCKYLHLQYKSNIQYAYAVTTFEVGPIFLVVDTNFFLNPIFLCQSKPF